MHLHLQADERQKAIARILAGHNLHVPGSAFELLVEPFNDIGRPQGLPFLRRELEEGQARLQRVLQAFHR